MLAVPKVWPMVLTLAAAHSLSGASCPAKISPKLCPLFEAGPDSTYLQVRIVLDPKVESSYVWDKSLPPTPRPLLIDSKELIAKYDLRQLAHPESAYVPMWPPQDLSPVNDEVLYHNASVTRADIAKLISETYVAAVEPGCSHRIPASLCSDINVKPDSSALFIGIGFQVRLEKDSLAREAFLSAYGIRDTNWYTPRTPDVPWDNACGASGYLASPAAIRALGFDPEITYVEQGHMVCLVSVRPIPRPKAGSRHTAWKQPDAYRLDGRLLPMGRSFALP